MIIFTTAARNAKQASLEILRFASKNIDTIEAKFREKLKTVIISAENVQLAHNYNVKQFPSLVMDNGTIVEGKDEIVTFLTQSAAPPPKVNSVEAMKDTLEQMIMNVGDNNEEDGMDEPIDTAQLQRDISKSMSQRKTDPAPDVKAPQQSHRMQSAPPTAAAANPRKKPSFFDTVQKNPRDKSVAKKMEEGDDDDKRLLSKFEGDL